MPTTDDGNPTLGQILASLNDLKRNAVTTDMLNASLKSLKETVVPSFSISPPLREPEAAFPLEEPFSPSAPPLSQISNDASVNTLSAHSLMPNAASDSISQPTPLLTPPTAPPTAPPAAPPVAPPPAPNSTRHGPRSASGSASRRAPQSGLHAGSSSARQPLAASQQNNRQNQLKKRRDVSRSRPQTIIGSSVKNGLISVKGADLTVNRYVGRFHNDAALEDVRKFIVDQGVTVVELEDLETKHGRFRSFRLRVKRIELPRIEDPEFWPEGVILSPFFRPRGGDKTDGGLPAETTASNG